MFVPREFISWYKSSPDVLQDYLAVVNHFGLRINQLFRILRTRNGGCEGINKVRALFLNLLWGIRDNEVTWRYLCP